MLTHPLENLDPAQSVQVLPRHLAGPGSVDPRTVWAFPFEEGWPFAQTEAGTATAFSPCLRLQTTFDPQPDKPGKGTWTINAHRAPFTPPAWRITFDATTPAEILHDVHSELLDLYLQDGDSAQHRASRPTAPRPSSPRRDSAVYATAMPPALPANRPGGRGAGTPVSRTGRRASRSARPPCSSLPSPPRSSPPNHCGALSRTSPPRPAAPSTSPLRQAGNRTATHPSLRYLPPRPPATPDDLPCPLPQGAPSSCPHDSSDPLLPSPSRRPAP